MVLEEKQTGESSIAEYEHNNNIRNLVIRFKFWYPITLDLSFFVESLDLTWHPTKPYTMKDS